MEKQLYSEHGEPETEEFLEKKKKKRLTRAHLKRKLGLEWYSTLSLTLAGQGAGQITGQFFFQWVDRSQYPLFEPLMFMQRGWGIIQRKRQDK